MGYCSYFFFDFFFKFENIFYFVMSIRGFRKLDLLENVYKNNVMFFRIIFFKGRSFIMVMFII